MNKKQSKLILLLFTFVIGVFIFSTAFTQQLDQANMRAKLPSHYFNQDTVITTAKSPTRAMIRSLVFPGWGQWYNNKKLKAVVIFGAEVGLIANSIYLNQKYLEWNQKFKNSQPGLEQQIIIANREFYINNRNASNWWLVGVILFSMADAFVDAHLSDFDESPELSTLEIHPIGYGDFVGIQLSIGLRF